METEETKPIEETMSPQEPTVGDIMAKSANEGIKYWVILSSALIYLAGIVYAEVHGLTMLTKGVAPEMRIWATLGMVAAGLTAVTLPIALKVWTIEAKQRIAATMFYLLDFAFLAFNAMTDFNVQAGYALLPWAQTYVSYILPASPLFIAAFWSLIWGLDPSVKESVLKLSLRAAMKESMARQVAQAARGQNVTATVNKAAQKEVELALTELFGHPVYAVDMNTPAPQTKGLLRSFFGSLLERVLQASSLGMPSQSNDQHSEE